MAAMRSAVVNLQFVSRFYAAELAVSTTCRRSHSLKLSCLLIAPALVSSTAFSFHSARAFAQTQSQQQREISRVQSWFTGKSLAEVKSALARLRPEAPSQADKAFLMRDLPLVSNENRIENDGKSERLRARLARTLMLFERKAVVELILFRHDEPIIYSKPGVVVVISTEVIKIVAADDAALNGVVAHELAHEYVAMDLFQATQSGNLGRIRELELFCDAVAVVVLLDLKLDPAGYAKALRRIATHSREATKLNNGENSHPALEARFRVISDISALFKNRFAQSR